jgi:hypothetical protein
MTTGQSPPPFFLSVPVWGEEYVRIFLEVSLAAQLAPGNLPSLPQPERCRYLIYTTAEFAERIRAAPSFAAAANLLPMDVRVFDLPVYDPADPASWGKRYEVKSDCYRSALRDAENAGAVNVLLNADIVLADGFLRRAAEVIGMGKRVIEVVGPRTLKGPVEAALAAYRTGSNPAIAVPPRALTQLSVRHLHPMAQMHLWDAPIDAFHPSHMYFRVGSSSLVARCFHYYPIVIHPRATGAMFSTTIDQDLVDSACPDFSDTYLPPDSDDMYCCELSDPSHFVGAMFRRPVTPQNIAGFFSAHCTPRSRSLLSHTSLLRGADEPASAWDAAIIESDRVVVEFERALAAGGSSVSDSHGLKRRGRFARWTSRLARAVRPRA